MIVITPPPNITVGAWPTAAGSHAGSRPTPLNSSVIQPTKASGDPSIDASSAGASGAAPETLPHPAASAAAIMITRARDIARDGITGRAPTIAASAGRAYAVRMKPHLGDLTVSAVGLGCMGMTGGVYGAVDEGEAIATIHRALERGVTLLDSAH